MLPGTSLGKTDKHPCHKNFFEKLAITCLDHLRMVIYQGKKKHRYL